MIGVNSRLDEVQAAFLNIKLQALSSINEHKRKLASLYFTHLDKQYILPVRQEGYYDVFHIFCIRHPKRDSLKKYLKENNITTEIHYPIPPHKQTAYSSILQGHFPISEEIHHTVLSLPISYMHTEEDIFRVINLMNQFN